MEVLNNLKIKIFADGADEKEIIKLNEKNYIKGFTTNPSLMKKANIKNYETFAKNLLGKIKKKPISFEVFSDDLNLMEKQAEKIATWGKNVNVKIPITNTKAESTVELIQSLSSQSVKINVTAMMTTDQVANVLPALGNGPGGYVSVFAGRIADAGMDPLPIMKDVVALLKSYPNVELIWASPRELYNVVQADEIGCDIITATNNILKKLPSLGKDLMEFSLDTVKMFYNDAQSAGYTI